MSVCVECSGEKLELIRGKIETLGVICPTLGVCVYRERLIRGVCISLL